MIMTSNLKKFKVGKGGSLVVSALAFSAIGHGFDPCGSEEKFRCPNMLSLVSLAGITNNKVAVLRIRTLTGAPLCRESQPLCRLKNPTVVYIITCRLFSCKTGVYTVRLLIILESGCISMYRKKNRNCTRQIILPKA